MKKSVHLPKVLRHPATIRKGGDEKERFEFFVRSPIEEPARGLRSYDRMVRHSAVVRLAEIAADERGRQDAMEAIRELGKAAREHEDEVSTAFIEKLGVETYSEMIAASARPNKILLGAWIAGTAALAIAGGMAGSVPAALFSFAALGALLSRFLTQKPAANILKMTRSDAWKILEGHERRELHSGIEE